MDIFYAVKQLDHEIALEKARLVEKIATRDKLYSALSPQERTLFGAPEPAAAEEAPPTSPAS